MPDTPANNKARKPNGKTLGSVWGDYGLNENLVVKINAVTEGNIEAGQGAQTYDVDTSQPTVESLFEEADFVIEAQYSTPFETSNPEGRMPNLMGMIQSGQANAAFYGFFAAEPTGVGEFIANGVSAAGERTGISDNFKQTLTDAQDQLQGLMGKSNFTKINSRQIYTSSNSVRVTGTLIFQAWSNAKTEVEDALEQLQRWASPVELSAKSLLAAGFSDGFSQAMFPSTIPTMVQLQYGGKTYTPMVIENVSAPITAPMNKDGSRIAIKVQITLLSLTAWDAQNITGMRR